MHIVHYKSSLGNLSEAEDKPEGLAVLAFMFEVNENDLFQAGILESLDSVSFRLISMAMSPVQYSFQ